MKRFLGVFVALFVSLGLVSTGRALTQEEIGTLIGIRSEIFGGMLLRDTVPGYVFSGIQEDTAIPAVNGSTQPVFELNAEDQVIINWRVSDKMAAAFADAIALPPHMQLAKVSTLQKRGHCHHHKKKHYMITLNIFKSSGLSTGNKAEWRTYVTIGNDQAPRALVFDKQSGEAGIDPIDGISIPTGPVQWDIENGIATGLIVDGSYGLSLEIPQNHARKAVQHIDILNAADTTFSLTGAPVKIYYNSTVALGEVYSVKKKSAQINGDFPWLGFTKKVENILFPSDGEMIVQPLASMYMPASPAEEMAYGGFVLGIFGSFQPGAQTPPIMPEQGFTMLMQQFGMNPTFMFALMAFYDSMNVMQGQVPTMSFDIAANPKPMFVNYRISPCNVQAFEDTYLPEGYELAKVKFFVGQRKSEYAVSLNMYQLQGNSPETSGFRAEWSTYVTEGDDPNPRFIVLQAHVSVPGLDPVYAFENYDPNNFLSVLAPPSIVNYTSDDGIIEFVVGTMDPMCMVDPAYCIMADLVAHAAIQIPADADTASPTKEWMQANDFIHWGNGVADSGFSDSTLNDGKLLVFQLEQGDVVYDPSFNGFVDPTPMHVILFDSDQRFALKPWSNLEEMMMIGAMESSL